MTPKREIESEINFNPTVSHQAMKNGFNALKIIPNNTGLPAMNETPWLLLLNRFLRFSFFVVLMICIVANMIMEVPPTKPNTLR
jgi:hypothetical protein